MNLKPIKANMTELTVGGLQILISYQTPVACYSLDGGYKKTNKFWSRTTSRHINQWIPDSGEVQITEVDQDFFDNLLNEVK